ncbi:MAG TPA: phosphatase PAP2 family protein [Candidatus Nanopelagicaceae bacterium]
MIWSSLEVHRRQERNHAIKVSVALFAAFLLVTEQVLTKSYLYRLDHKIKALKHHTFRGMSSHILLALDDLGLRSLTATCLLVTAVIIAYRFKSWRPINLSLAALLLLNGVVGLSKLVFGRTKPRLQLDLLHDGGLSYPSGHAANALLTWGMLAYLIYRYSQKAPFKGLRLDWLVALITTIVCVVSLLRNTHWFSDLLGGVFLGGSILVFLIAADRAWPSERQPS